MPNNRLLRAKLKRRSACRHNRLGVVITPADESYSGTFGAVSRLEIAIFSFSLAGKKLVMLIATSIHFVHNSRIRGEDKLSQDYRLALLLTHKDTLP